MVDTIPITDSDGAALTPYTFTITNASTAYKLKTSYLDKKATATHKLRLWIDEAVDIIHKVFKT